MLGFRAAAALSLSPLQGVLLELMTADTRKGTDTAKGSEMLTALRWCLGEDSSGKKLPGNEGRDELLWEEPEYNILLFFGEVGLKPLRSSPLNTLSCSGKGFWGGAEAPGKSFGLTLQPPAFFPFNSQFWSRSLRSSKESDPSVLDLTSGMRVDPAAGIWLPARSSSVEKMLHE